MELGLLSVFAAGLATLATPCVLPMLPVYFALLMGAGIDSAQSTRGARGLPLAAIAFVAGFSLVFTLLGMAASGIGQLLDHHRELLLVGGGGLIILFGLKYLGVLRIAVLDRTIQLERNERTRGLPHAFLFGIVFGLGWTPCVGPILGSVLTYTAVRTSSPWIGAGYLLVYSLGVGLPLIALSLVAERAIPWLKRLNRELPKIEKATGVVMVAVGSWLVYPQLVSPATAADTADPVAVTDSGTPITPAIGEPTRRPRFVAFFSQHCPACERMKPRLDQLRQDCVGHRVEILEVNVDEPRNRVLVEAQELRGVPAMRLLDTSGTVTVQLYGERPLAQLRQAAANLVSARCGGEVATTSFSTPQDAAACGVSVARSTAPGEGSGSPTTQCQTPAPNIETP